ncbi:MAG: cadherin repeat domain-containing protein [Pseudohongiella sp.]|nr:cadherin repeat domain-containing protein [Pseudohongiella sp.]
MHTLFSLLSRSILALMLLVAAQVHAVEGWRITEIFTNADGSVQYIKLSTTQNNQQNLAGQRLSTFDASGRTGQTFTFPSALSSSQTAFRSVLLGTEAFSALTQLHVDYRIPDGFLFTEGGSVRFANFDTLSYRSDQVPVNGLQAMSAAKTPVTPSPANFIGQSKNVSVETTAIFNDANGVLKLPVVFAPGAGVANATLRLSNDNPIEFSLVDGYFYDGSIVPGTQAAHLEDGKLFVPDVRVGGERYAVTMTLLNPDTFVFGNLEINSVRPEPTRPVLPPAPGAATLPAGFTVTKPDALEMTGAQVQPNTPVGTPVAAFALLPDASAQLYWYQLVDGAGSENNNLFTIVNGYLVTARALTAESPRRLNIRVRATGPAGHSLEQALHVALVPNARYPGIFRISDKAPNYNATPFPVVNAALTFNDDLEATEIHWIARAGETYAIERSADEISWQLVSDGRSLKAGVSGPMSFRDDTVDLFLTPKRYYRVRHVSVDPKLLKPIEMPSPEARFGKAMISLQSGRSIIQLPSFEDELVLSSGRADYYELYIPGSIGAQWRSTSPSFDLELSRNFAQGAAINVWMFAYNWSGQLVGASEMTRQRGYFNEFSVPRLDTQKPVNLRRDPNWGGLANIYGSSANDTLSVYYSRTDPVTRSRMLGVVLRDENRQPSDVGAFTFFLPQGVREGRFNWTSPASYNVSSAGFTGVQMYYQPSSFVQFGAWSIFYPDFHWSSLGYPSSTPSGASSGYFEIEEISRDSYLAVFEIRLFGVGGQLGRLTFVHPAYLLP